MIARMAIAVSLLCAASTARADEDELDMGRVVAVEPRAFRLVHEFRAALGVLPVDAFETAITVGGSYTLHLSDLWAWEAVAFEYAINVDTGVEEMLAARWSIAPAFERAGLQYLLASNALLTPLYGKLAVLSESVLYADAHLSGGIGVARYTDGFRPMISAGPGVRFYLGSVLSMRVDVRSAIVPGAPGGTDLLLGINISLSTSFGAARVTDSREAPAPKKTINGFEALDELFPESRPEEEQP